MKKSAIIIASILASAAFTCCTKENVTESEPAVAAQEISLTVGPETKTAYDGTHTTWTEGDSLAVFICEKGTESSATWTLYRFDCTDAANAKFTGSVSGLSADKQYDVYAFYPYYKGWNSPAAAVINVAYNEKIDGVTGAVSGKYEPLWGAQTTGQTMDAFSITMQQVATYFRFSITAEEAIEVSSITMTAPSTAYLGRQLTINATDGTFSNTGSSLLSSITASVTNGQIAAGQTGVFNVTTRPFALTSGQKLTCVINTADGKKMTFDITAPADGYNFEAGKVNKIARDFKADYEALHYTWDLSIDQTTNASTTELDWDSTCATMVAAQANSTTATNNYYPGTSGKSYTSTRFYTGSTLTISPKAGYKITNIVFEATSESYATALKSSTWTNGGAAVSSKTVTVTPTDGLETVAAQIGATCGFTSVTVYYEEVEVVKTLSSITAAGYTSSYNVGDTYSFDGTVTAAYSDGSTKTVSDEEVTVVSSPDMSTAGTKTVTISYTDEGVTVTQNITIKVSNSSSTSITSYADGDYIMIDYYSTTGKYYALSGSVASGAVSAIDVTDAVTLNTNGTISVNLNSSIITSAMTYNISKADDIVTILNGSNTIGQSTSSSSLTSSGTWALSTSGSTFGFESSYIKKEKTTYTCLLIQVSSYDSSSKVQVESLVAKAYATSNRGSVQAKGQCYTSGYYYLVPVE